jgi:hypothetical protein
MDGDHVHSDELLGVADPLGHDLPDMRHELDLQLSDPATGVADAEVVGDHPLLLGVERLVHGERRRQPTARAVPLSRVVLRNREEECISLDLHEPHGRHRLEHRFQQTLGDLLRVREVQPVKPHELRVAGDVRQQEERSLGQCPSECRTWRSGVKVPQIATT